MSVFDPETQPALDRHGHLLDPGQWTPEVARILAARDGIELSAAHWELINLVRAYYAEYGTPPGMRMLVACVRARHGPDKAGSRYLYRLFPDSPARQLSCYAGLPKPVSCI